MKFSYPGIVLMAIISGTFSVSAQSIADSTKKAEKSYFQGAVDFLTDAVYNGRKDSVANPYLSVDFGYYHKSGWYISGSASYQTNNHVFDLFSVDAGYNWEISDKFSASFNADKPFYNKTSTSIASGIKASVDAGLTYDTDFITAEASFSAVFSKKTDILTSVLLSHTFEIDGFNDDSYWAIKPEVTANFGTQHFFDDYKARSSKRRILSATSTTVASNNKFQVLDYEFSLPLSYNAKNWGITFSPVYAIPRNPVTTTTTITTTTQAKTKTTVSTDTEKLKNLFYGQVTFDFKFK